MISEGRLFADFRDGLGQQIQARCISPGYVDRSHALRGNASTDALRSAFDGTRSVPGCIPTRSVGTISEGRLFADFRDGLGQQVKARRINPGHVRPSRADHVHAVVIPQVFHLFR